MTKKYALVEGWYDGVDMRIFDTEDDARLALNKAYNDALNSICAHPENCYCTPINAQVKTEYVEDLWRGVIKEVLV